MIIILNDIICNSNRFVDSGMVSMVFSVSSSLIIEVYSLFY